LCKDEDEIGNSGQIVNSGSNSKGEPERTSSLIFRKFPIIAAASLALLFATTATRAQDTSQDELKVTPTAADHDAALAAKNTYRHARAANNATGQGLRAREITERKALASAEKKLAMGQAARDCFNRRFEIRKASESLHAILINCSGVN
jgi:hypothetical protein